MLKAQVVIIIGGTLLLLLYLDGCGCRSPPRTPTSVKRVCRWEKVLFEGNTVKTHKNVATPDECHEKCEKNSDCHAWSHMNNNYEIEENKNKCRLKNKEYNKGRSKGWSNIVSGSKYCGDVCPMRNVIYVGKNIGKKKKVASWKDCRRFCQETKGCAAWSYVTNDYKKYESNKKMCRLKNNNYYITEKGLENVLSGSRNCKETHPKLKCLNNVNYELHNVKEKIVESQNECARWCITTEECYAWSYFTKHYGRKKNKNRKKCKLKDRTYYKKKTKLANVISGPKGCTENYSKPKRKQKTKPKCLNDVVYVDHNVKEMTVESHTICALKCLTTKYCYAWSYVTNHYGEDGNTNRKKCRLKDRTYNQGKKKLADVISGPKGCTGPKNDYVEERDEILRESDIEQRFNEGVDESDAKPWESDFEERFDERDDDSDDKPWESDFEERFDEIDDDSDDKPWESYFEERFDERDDDSDDKPWESDFDLHFDERDDEINERPWALDFASRLNRRDNDSDEEPWESDFALRFEERDDEK